MINGDILKENIIKGENVYIADTARVFGKVSLGNRVSIWFGAVLRGDADTITIGNNTNIQENAVVHVDPGCPVIIGEACIIGHAAIVHGATLENNVLVGMHATILNKVVVGSFSIIGAGAVVPEGMVIPPYSLVLGVPAKVIKTITEDQIEKIKRNAAAYVSLGSIYLKEKFHHQEL